MPRARRTVALCGLLLIIGGCALRTPGPLGQSPLAPLSGGADNLTLEIFSVPAPLDDSRMETLWEHADEQCLPIDLRRRLAANGIRAGVVGPHLPAELTELLHITADPISAEHRTILALDADVSPQLLVKQPLPAKRNDLMVSRAVDEASLILNRDGQLIGNRYPKAEGHFDLRVFPEGAAKARLELQPELHYGEVKHRVTGSPEDSSFTYTSERPRQVFTDLKLVASLTPGQMLLLSCDRDKPLSVGHYFFTQASGDKLMQKLWVLRLAQAGADRVFAEPAAAEVDLPVTDP